MVIVSFFQVFGAPLALPDVIRTTQEKSWHGDGANAVPSVSCPTQPKAAKSAALPDFVPKSHALSCSDASEQPGEVSERLTPPTDRTVESLTGSMTAGSVLGQTAPASAGSSSSTKARPVLIKVEPIPGMELPKKSVWPKFIGAKMLFGEAKKPAPMEARAIGSYSRGCLSGAVSLPIDGPAWQEMRLSRNRNWGHPQLIALVEKFAKDAQKLDGWPGLLVGDIAQPRGGPMVTGHASHQIGLDVDIWLTSMPKHRLSRKERETLEATSMLNNAGLAVNPKAFTAKQVALIKRAASYLEVERIFVHPAIKKALCEAAGTDRKWLWKARPWYGHYYHFHMRIKCPLGFSSCTPQAPLTGDDGCGKEVDKWLAKMIPAKREVYPPSPPGPLEPPQPPIMLSELPKECQAVLVAAGPEPIAILRATLPTRVEVKKAQAKAVGSERGGS